MRKKFLLKKIFLFLFLLFITIFLSSEKIYAQSLPLLMQPGRDCGVGTTSATLNINDPNNYIYRCCYSSIENWEIKIPNLPEDTPFPINQLGHIINFLNNRIDTLPFVIWFLPGDSPFSLGMIRKVVTNHYSNNRCQKGAIPIGVLGEDCYCRVSDNSIILYTLSPLCQMVNEKERRDCYQCLGYDSEKKEYIPGKNGVYTALGCIKTDLASFIKENIFGFLTGLAGLTALFCIIYAAFQLQTSQGSPEKIKKSQELLTSCIMGLMLIIFSVFILKLVGVSILRIPGFGR